MLSLHLRLFIPKKLHPYTFFNDYTGTSTLQGICSKFLPCNVPFNSLISAGNIFKRSMCSVHDSFFVSGRLITLPLYEASITSANSTSWNAFNFPCLFSSSSSEFKSSYFLSHNFFFISLTPAYPLSRLISTKGDRTDGRSGRPDWNAGSPASADI